MACLSCREGVENTLHKLHSYLFFYEQWEVCMYISLILATRVLSTWLHPHTYSKWWISWYVLAAWVDRYSRTEYFVRGLSLRILFSRKILISYQYLQVVFNFADELMKWNEMGLCQKKCNNISCAIPLQCIEILSEGAH